MFKKSVILFTLFLTFVCVKPCLAHQPIIVGNQTIRITEPEISRAFYDELGGLPQRYFIESAQNFELYLNLLVPLKANPNGRYSAKVYDLNNNYKLITTLEGEAVPWSLYYENFAKDYYYKGPEFDQNLPAGKYVIDVYSGDNQGRYVLAIGKIENFSAKDTIKIVGILRDLKVNFFNTSPFKLIITIFGAAYFAVIFILTLLLWTVYKFVLHKTKRFAHLSIKASLKKNLIKLSLSVVLMLVSLYTWNPIVLTIADILVFETVSGFFILPSKAKQI